MPALVLTYSWFNNQDLYNKVNVLWFWKDLTWTCVAVYWVARHHDDYLLLLLLGQMSFFVVQMSFLTPSCQHQSTKGNKITNPNHWPGLVLSPLQLDSSRKGHCYLDENIILSGMMLWRCFEWNDAVGLSCVMHCLGSFNPDVSRRQWTWICGKEEGWHTFSVAAGTK